VYLFVEWENDLLNKKIFIYMKNNNIPLISRIMRAMILEDYTQALDLVTSEEFDPNQRTKTWDSPIISAIITITEGMAHKKPLDEMKKVIQTIIKHKNYNPNAVDAENDDMDLAADMLMEAADIIEEAADLLVQAASLLRGEDIEADRCFPCCVVEVYCDDEL
jgi:hypothetical protein